jgi:hypothetical protein
LKEYGRIITKFLVSPKGDERDERNRAFCYLERAQQKLKHEGKEIE